MKYSFINEFWNWIQFLTFYLRFYILDLCSIYLKKENICKMTKKIIYYCIISSLSIGIYLQFVLLDFKFRNCKFLKINSLNDFYLKFHFIEIEVFFLNIF